MNEPMTGKEFFAHIRFIIVVAGLLWAVLAIFAQMVR